MKFVQTVISSQGFREQSANPHRLDLLADLTRLCAREGGHLLLIPAGFLTADTEERVPGLIDEVRRVAEATGVAVIGGVDVDGAASKRSISIEEAVKESRLGYFGFAAGPGLMPAEGTPYRQTSITSSDAELVSEEAVPGEGRVVTIDGLRVAILICGELFSRRARGNVGATEPNLVVDIGHSGMGTGLIPAMRNVANAGKCPVAHSQHLSTWYGRSLHFVDAAGEQQSVVVDEEHVIEQGATWAAWASREV